MMVDLSECSVVELTAEIFNRYKGTGGSFVSAHTLQSNQEPLFFTTWAGSTVGCLGVACILRSELEARLANCVVEDPE